LIWITKSRGISLSDCKKAGISNLLDETVASAAALFFFLQLSKFELAERLKNISEILFSDTEMNVANIKTVEGNRTVVSSGGLGIAGLSIFFCFSELSDDGYSEELLAS